VVIKWHQQWQKVVLKYEWLMKEIAFKYIHVLMPTWSNSCRQILPADFVLCATMLISGCMKPSSMTTYFVFLL
jgi:hypothetical protein